MTRGPLYSEEALIRMLREMAKALGRAPTYREVSSTPTVASGQTYRNRFGSWKRALLAADLIPGQIVMPTRVEVLDAFARCVEKLGRMPYVQEWPYPAWAVRRYFATARELATALHVEIPEEQSSSREDVLRWVGDYIQRQGFAPLLEDLPMLPVEVTRQFGSMANLLAELYLTAVNRHEKRRQTASTNHAGADRRGGVSEA